MIEAIFGAEESYDHNLRIRFGTEENRKRTGRGGHHRRDGWNLKILNRLRRRKVLGMEVASIPRS